MPVMAKKRKPPKRTGEALSVYLPPPLLAALDRYLSSLRPAPTKTATVRAALEDFLKAKGFPAGPPPPAG
jgi:hypothetical protein